MPTPASGLDRVGLIINGLPFLAEPADATTKIYDIRGRQAVTSTGPDSVISLRTEALDTELADRAASMRRVKDAAAGPFTPKAQRPSARVAAVRRAAKEYHAATWSAGYTQGQADLLRQPLDERLTPDDVSELIELTMTRVLADPALRAAFQRAAEAADFESEFAAA